MKNIKVGDAIVLFLLDFDYLPSEAYIMFIRED